MNRSAKRQQHEKARKRHKHELEVHAKELANKPRTKFPFWILAVGIGLLLGLVLVATFWN